MHLLELQRDGMAVALGVDQPDIDRLKGIPFQELVMLTLIADGYVSGTIGDRLALWAAANAVPLPLAYTTIGLI